MSQLEELSQHSLVVADTGDIEQVARWKPQDATTNPSLLLTAAEDPRYQHLAQRSVREAGGDATLAMDWMFVLFGTEILKYVKGRVSTEVDARLSFDTEKSLRKARSFISLYDKVGVSRNSVNAVENGKFDPSLPLAFRIADAFELKIEDVFLRE